MPDHSTYAARLAAIEHRLAQATPGPWTVLFQGEPFPAQVVAAPDVEGRSWLVGVFRAQADATLAGHAKADLEWLVEQVRAGERQG